MAIVRRLWLVSLSLMATPLPATELVLRDAQGDVGSATAARDIVELRLTSGSGRILVAVTTVAGAVSRRTGAVEDPALEVVDVEVGQLVVLALDTDNDSRTGDSPLGHDHVTGFDWEAWILVCAEENEASRTRHRCGPTSGPAVTGGRPVVQLMSSNPNVMDAEEFASGQIEGKLLTAEIPYSKIGMKRGETIRIYAMERGLAAAAADRKFEPVQLKLD